MKGMFAGIVVLFFSGFSLAGVILQPVSVSTDMGSFTSWFPEHTIDQSGLADKYVSGVTDFDTYLSGAPAAEIIRRPTWYGDAGNISGNFDLSLGRVFEVEALALWNEDQVGSGQGVREFNLFADTQADFSSAVLLGSYSALADFSAFQVFGFQSIAAEFIRMEILSNHGASEFTGIMEIAFKMSDRLSVAEPSSLYIVVFGFAGLFLTFIFSNKILKLR